MYCFAYYALFAAPPQHRYKRQQRRDRPIKNQFDIHFPQIDDPKVAPRIQPQKLTLIAVYHCHLCRGRQDIHHHRVDRQVIMLFG